MFNCSLFNCSPFQTISFNELGPNLFYLCCILSTEKIKEVMLQMKKRLALASKNVSYYNRYWPRLKILYILGER